MLGALFLAICGGVLSSIQGPTNTALSRISSRSLASFFSFLSGTIVLFILVQIIGTGDFGKVSTVPFWQIFGGVFGFIVILSTIYATPRLGVALTTMSLMVGKVVGGVGLDLLGLFGLQRRVLSVSLGCGIVLLALGIIFVSIDRGRSNLSSKNKSSRKEIILPIVVMFLAGCGNSIQAPINCALSHTIGTIEAAFVSFVGGLICSFLLFLVMSFRTKQKIEVKKSEPWIYLGGVYGASICTITIIATPILGTTSLVSFQMLGQMCGGIVIDAFGMLRSIKLKITKMRLVGIVLIAFGAFLAVGF